MWLFNKHYFNRVGENMTSYLGIKDHERVRGILKGQDIDPKNFRMVFNRKSIIELLRRAVKDEAGLKLPSLIGTGECTCIGSYYNVYNYGSSTPGVELTP
jgi:hypothetical protein